MARASTDTSGIETLDRSEVTLRAKGSLTGVVLSDQLRSLDWRAGRARLAAQAPEKVVREVLDKPAVLLES